MIGVELFTEAVRDTSVEGLSCFYIGRQRAYWKNFT